MKRALILIVDDEVDIAEMIGALLEMEDYEVAYAANGRDGLDAVARRRPDLILTDVMMPLMTGPEMLAELRGHGSHGEIPVIMMSAANAAPVAESWGVPFIMKPFRIEELVSMIEAQLER